MGNVRGVHGCETLAGAVSTPFGCHTRCVAHSTHIRIPRRGIIGRAVCIRTSGSGGDRVQTHRSDTAASHQPQAISHSQRDADALVRVRVRVCACVFVRACVGGGRGVPEEPLTGTHSTSMWMKLCSNRTPELVKFVPFFQKISYIRTQY